MAATKKKRPNKQHATKGASFFAVAETLRAVEEGEEVPQTAPGLLKVIRQALEKEGRTVRSLR